MTTGEVISGFLMVLFAIVIGSGIIGLKKRPALKPNRSERNEERESDILEEHAQENRKN